MTSRDLDQVVSALKGAAESTRLRLLALLAHGELTVGELCDILGQSQPRISRHLRVLTEAGLLDRFREQQCVYYRTPAAGRPLDWTRTLLALADPDAPQLRRDRERAAAVLARRQPAAEAVTGEPELRDGLAAVLREELGPRSVGDLLDIGTGLGLMLEILGPRARHAVGIDLSARALRRARARIHGSGLAHCEFRRGDMHALPCSDASFDTVTMDRVLAEAARPAEAIAEAARTLRPEGLLVSIEDFDRLAAGSADNPLARLRRWFADAELKVVRLRPCDFGSRHLVIAQARHEAAGTA